MRKLNKVLLGLMIFPWGLGVAIISCLSCGDPPDPPKPEEKPKAEVILTEADCKAMCAKDGEEVALYLPQDESLVLCSCQDKAHATYATDGTLSPDKCYEFCTPYEGVDYLIVFQSACMCTGWGSP